MSDELNFIHILTDLQDLEKPYPTAQLYLLSDLGSKDVAVLERAWADIPVERRRTLMEDLGEIGEANYEVNFDQVYKVGLEDEDAEVRATAINNLWESESPELMAPFIDLMQHDPAIEVRAAAASALGRFVYLGEVEEIRQSQARRVEDVLLKAITGEDDLEVRRRALESIAYSSCAEVPPLIEAAYASPDPLLRVSALFAMGRSADPRWAPQVLEEMDSAEPEVRYEAVRAVGELELAEALPTLTRLVEDQDVQVREAAIWSLGQVGGDQAREVLLNLLEDAEDDERDFIEDALENLTFHDEMLALPLVEWDDDDLNALDDEFDDSTDDDDDYPGKLSLNGRLN
jgi:HEAT repeat protein